LLPAKIAIDRTSALIVKEFETLPSPLYTLHLLGTLLGNNYVGSSILSPQFCDKLDAGELDALLMVSVVASMIYNGKDIGEELDEIFNSIRLGGSIFNERMKVLALNLFVLDLTPEDQDTLYAKMRSDAGLAARDSETESDSDSE
jgi:hypothetical protein